MDYTRIRRGMIFWRSGDITERDDRSGEDRKYPWIVVSSDERNMRHHNISIVPILQMTKTPKYTDNYVEITFHNNASYIMCDVIQTVQASSLESSRYDGWITEEVMDKVSESIRSSLSVNYTSRDLMTTSVADRFEFLIDQIVQKKLSEIRSATPQSEIDDIAIKVSETIESLFDVSSAPTEEKSIISEEIPDVVNEEAMSDSTKKRRWTQSAIIEFLHKYDTEGPEQVMREYKFKNMRTVAQTRRSLLRKLESVQE